MKVLSEAGYRLIRQLWWSRDRAWGRERRAREVLGWIEERGEPALIPDVAAFLLAAAARVVERGAHVLRTLLDATSNGDLVALEVNLRHYVYRAVWHELEPTDVDRIAGGRALVAVCCSHPRGHVRERAVRRLGETRTGFELRFLLLRANDWLEAVRVAAHAAIREWLAPPWASAFAAGLDLVDGLARTGRADHTALVADIASLLAAPACSEALGEALHAPDRAVRQRAYRIALDSPASADAVETGLNDDDEAIRVWCARRARELLSAARLGRAIDRILRDRAGGPGAGPGARTRGGPPLTRAARGRRPHSTPSRRRGLSRRPCGSGRGSGSS